MRAIILATGYNEEMRSFLEYRPTPLLQIVNKPIIVHIIERLKKQKITECHLILHHLPKAIEDLLGDGDRWGVQLFYYLARSLEDPFSSVIPFIERFEEEPLLIATADLLPEYDDKALLEASRVHSRTFLFFPEKVWTGWAVIHANDLQNFSSLFFTEQSQSGHHFPAHHFLSVRNFIDWEKSNQKIIEHKEYNSYFPTTAKQVYPGVWISHAAFVDPSTKVVPPVFIGENCYIKGQCQIGPDAVIENDTMIDNNTLIKKSLITQHSYVGEGLEVQNSIVDRNQIANLILHTNVVVTNDFILSALEPPVIKSIFRKFVEQVLAFFLIVLFSPFILVGCLIKRRKREMCVKLPAGTHPVEWRSVPIVTFRGSSRVTFLAFLLRLINVVKGHASFVGVVARTPEEVKNLPVDWRHLYLKSKIGIVTLADADFPFPPSSDDLYSAESFYAIKQGIWFDIRILLRWLKRTLTRKI